jgi:sugar/nucleoside kinase (ribokinase family)
LVLEGYLWEVRGAAAALPAIVQHARANGALVALTAGDAGVVQRHSTNILAAIAAGVDIWFGNESEAAALVSALKEQQHTELSLSEVQLLSVGDQDHRKLTAPTSSSGSSNNSDDAFTAAPSGIAFSTAAVESSLNNSSSSSFSSPQSSHYSGSVAEECALSLGTICPMVAVTDGSRGSYITAGGQLAVVPPYWRAQPPVDTCGAGEGLGAGRATATAAALANASRHKLAGLVCWYCHVADACKHVLLCECCFMLTATASLQSMM